MKIFVVDDDPVARLIAIDQLRRPDYELRELESGAALLAAAPDEPDLILLDIEMPGLDGIAACRALRQSGNDHAQVIFVSAHDDLDTRLAAYDAGGSDFIVKPYDEHELAHKVQAIERLVKKRQALKEQAQDAQSAAFAAMSSMGETGVVLQCLRASFSCHTPDQLAEAIFGALRQYDLNAILEIRLLSGRRSFSSSSGMCTPLEESILKHATTMGRIFQFKDRMAINYPSVTLLLLGGLALDDPDRVGRLRDHLAILVEGADARVQAMEVQRQRSAQAEIIVHTVAELGKTLADIERSQAASRVQALEINSNYSRDLTKAFVRLGLSEDQERAIANMAQATYDRMNALMDDDWSISDRLRTVTDRLRTLTN